MHKLLARQIAKATNEAGSIDLEKLFALVADAYADLDRDRRRTDRSMSLMIEELDAVQRNLEHMVIERTMVSPAEFVPIAEEIGLIVPLGEWVIKQACADAAQWAGDECVAVNLSPTQLINRNLLPAVLGALASSQLPADRLEFEITEAVLMHNSEVTLRVLHQLRALGISVSMDDFGTGYSSLSYLRSFPFDKIKIDRCFIKGLGYSSESDAIVRAVAGLANSLDMTTTAEGVETREQLDLVRRLGCTDAQGFFYSEPMSARDMSTMFTKRRKVSFAAA